MKIITQDKRILQGIDILDIYDLENIENKTYKVKARMNDDEYITLGEYDTIEDMRHFLRIAQYEAALDEAETTVYMSKER